MIKYLHAIKRMGDICKYKQCFGTLRISFFHKLYKKVRKLPLQNGEFLTVEGGKVITFFKYGKLIALASKKKIFDPLVDPEHVCGIFKDFSEEQLRYNDFHETLPKAFVPDENICPICNKNFGQNNEKLMIHASNCNGNEEIQEIAVCSPPRKISRTGDFL